LMQCWKYAAALVALHPLIHGRLSVPSAPAVSRKNVALGTRNVSR
jgi:hypothetical protein